MKGFRVTPRELASVSRRTVLRRVGLGTATAAGGAGLIRVADDLNIGAAAMPTTEPRTHELTLTAKVPNAMDGVAGLNQAPVEPGAEFVYEFVATPAGSRWYHSHTDPALQVPLGLYGALIIEPRTPGPPYDREYTYVMAEWDAELTPAVAAGTAPRGAGDKTMRGGELGADFFLLNGKMHGAVPPITVREGDRVLIRLYNVGSMPHAFRTHGHSFAVVATDGNPVPPAAQLVKDTLLIGPAERYDLAFVADNPGVWMVHCHMEHHMANGMMTLLAYEGYAPTGPAGAFYTPIAAASGSATPSAGASGRNMGMAMGTPTAAETAPVTAPAPAAGPTAPISVVDDRFVPNAVSVAAGTTVVWTNNGCTKGVLGRFQCPVRPRAVRRSSRPNPAPCW